MYNLVYKAPEIKPNMFSVCAESGRYFQFSDEANFNENMKAFILENSSKLVCENTAMKVEKRNKDLVGFDIIYL